MYDLQEATEKLQESEYDPKQIYWAVNYHGLYVFRILQFGRDPEEADYDPFVSVNAETGEVKEFSILTDGDITEIAALVEQQAQEA